MVGVGLWPEPHSGGGTTLLSPVREPQAQRFCSTAVYPTCRRVTPSKKSAPSGGGMTDTPLHIRRHYAHLRTQPNNQKK